jgi:hypothetical protein
MKTHIITFTLALGVSTGLLTAQDGNPPREGQRPPPREVGNERDGRPPEGTEVLTDAQKQQVKLILSKYSPNALTADIARAIHEAFRVAELRGGPAMAEAIKSAGFDPDKLRDLAPPPGQTAGADQQPPNRQGSPAPSGAGRPEPPGQKSRGQGQYSIEQAISDRAQLNTIAFDGLAFLIGDLGSCTFLPPGKAADFFGFQYMRDVDANELGHNTSFVPRAANNVLYILNAEQKGQLVALAKEQEKLLAELAYKRFPPQQGVLPPVGGRYPCRKLSLGP